MNAADRWQLFFRAEAPGLVISVALRTGESSPLRCSPRYRSEPGGPPFRNVMKWRRPPTRHFRKAVIYLFFLIINEAPTFGRRASLIGLIISGCASSQVTNNSGSLLNKIRVGWVNFSENLDYCGDGCSTGFDVVAAGDNQIALKETSSSGWQTMNELLGPFQNGLKYSVNIIKNNSGNFCAELWKRDQTSSEFNDDTTRDLIGSHCFE